MRNPGRLERLLGILLLFSAVGWAFYIHLPLFQEGYLNAGDDHIHVAFSNEMARIWQEEGRLIGWNKLYATGTPIFLLRPPGFYAVTSIVHFLTNLTVEQSLKLIVLLGFCLYPLTVFWGSRLLNFDFWPSVFAGLLSPLPISIWGHTIDAYQYLGIHKQLLAILVFPPTVGALWALLKDGRCGALFAALFSFMFVTHPYIAYCFALLVPCMILALPAEGKKWHWQENMGLKFLWALVTVLLVSFWLIPFVSSPEAQVADPFLSRRNYFEVVGATTGETLRQFFLGGLLDTAKYAGPFGGSVWTQGNEWGWLDNSRWIRIPIVSILAFGGFLYCLIRPREANHGFISLSFLLGLLLIIGPDDFPVIDLIPFAKQFQNIHAVFLVDWAAVMLGGIGCYKIFLMAKERQRHPVILPVFLILVAGVMAGYGTSLYERTMSAKGLIDLRNIQTANGKLQVETGSAIHWRMFLPVVQKLNVIGSREGIATIPRHHEETVTYNLLPLMVDQPVFSSGFEQVGGVYSLLKRRFRKMLLENRWLQRLFNIHYVLYSPHFSRGKKEPMPDVKPTYKNRYWVLKRTGAEYGRLEALPNRLVGFVGTDRQWAALMDEWLLGIKGELHVPWIVNLSNSGLASEDIKGIIPLLGKIITGENAVIPELLQKENLEQLTLPGRKTLRKFVRNLAKTDDLNKKDGIYGRKLNYTLQTDNRKEEVFEVVVQEEVQPVLFKRMFYRGWKAFIGDKAVPVYRISPGLQMVIVPTGKHLVSWRYTGPNGWKIGSFLSMGGIVLFCALALFEWRRRALKKKEKVNYDSIENSSSGSLWLVWLPSGIWGIFICIFCFQTVSEAVLKKPVIISPKPDHHFSDSSGRFFWNYVSGVPRGKQQFSLEVSNDETFKEVLASRETDSNKTRISNLFKEPGPFYYRLRLVKGGRPYPWVGPIRIYGPEQ